MHKSAHHPRKTLNDSGMNDVKSAASFVKSIHDPWKCILSKALICKEAKHWNKKCIRIS